MCEPAESRSFSLDDIEQRTQEVVRLGTIGSRTLGGPAAAHNYLSNHLIHWVGLAVTELGETVACEMVAAALAGAEACKFDNGCDDGRCPA